MKYLLYLFVFTSSAKYAQSVGYLGKKISIDFDVNILPSFNDFLMSNNQRTIIDGSKVYVIKNNNYSIMKTNFNKSLAFNYTVSRRSDISLRFNHSKMNFIFKNYDNFSSIYLSSQKDIMQYKITEFDINLKFYKKNFIAPVGKYLSFGIGYCIASPKKESNEIKYLLSDFYYESGAKAGLSSSNFKPKFVVLNIGVGDKKINRKNLYFHYTLEYKYYYSQRLNTDDVSTAFSINDFIEQTIYRNVKRNLILSNLFNLRIGIGIIL